MNRLLQDDILHRHISHAYLLYGKTAAAEAEAMAFAAALNCLNPVNGEACGLCSHCVQLKTKHFPDLIILEPAKSTYLMPQIHDMLQQTALTVTPGLFRVFWLKQGDLLTENCANALLKTLEEPVENVVFLLTAENDDRILETIASRCRSVRITEGDALTRDEAFCGEVFDLLCGIKNQGMEYLFRSAEKYTKDKNAAAAFFETAAAILEDNYYYRRGGKAPAMCFPIKDWSEEQLFASWQWALSAPVLLGSNISLKLILENFLLDIKRNGGSYGNCCWCTL